MEQNRILEIVVGLFMAALFVMLAFVIINLGRKKGYVGNNIEIYTFFKNIKGLKTDAGVYLYGKHVGTVKEIIFPKEPGDDRIKVILSIKEPYVPFIRKDAIAKVSTKGVMGGRVVNLKPGKRKENIVEGDVIRGYTAADPIKAIETAGEVLIKTDLILETIGNIIDNYKDSNLLDYLLYIMSSVKTSVEAIEKSDGLLGELIHGTNYKKRVDRILYNSERITKNIDKLTVDLLEITSQIKYNKKSLLHEVIYGTSGEEIIKNSLNITKNIENITNKIKEGDGLIHNIVYKKSKIVEMANQIAKKADDVISTIQEGRGSVGAIIMDPTIYEDLKGIFGKIKRNEVLKSLIRFSIQQEEK